MSQRTTLRLVTVAATAATLDQLAKLMIRSVLAVGEQQNVGPGIALLRQAHTGVGSSTATFVVAGIFVLGGLLGARLDRPTPPIWLVSGLLTGGAISSFVELVVTGSTLTWLGLPLHAVVSLAYLEMLIGGVGLFFSIGQTRRRALRSVINDG